MKYQPFLIHLSPGAMHLLAGLIRADCSPAVTNVQVELGSLACEIEARLQHHAAGIETFKDVEPKEEWDK